jgi:ABC-type nitrate/sulfonate/bicarbonate transport system substrate-binding protein
MLYSHVAGAKEQPMQLMIRSRRILAAFLLSAAAATVGPVSAQALDKVTFGSNWVAEAEHGGFYQALADGTYKKYCPAVRMLTTGCCCWSRRSISI